MSALISVLESLQALDHERVKVLKERNQAPGDNERRALLDQEKAAAQDVQRLETQLKAEQAALNEAELDLRSCEEHLALSEKRLYSGEVVNAKELAQLEGRVAEERGQRGRLEEKCLAHMESLEAIRSRLEAASRRLEEVHAALVEFDEKRRIADAAARQVDEAYEAARLELLAALPEAARQKYLRIQDRYPGSALAHIRGESCTGCHTSLSRAEMERVRHSPGETTCENCGRILAY